MIKTILQLKLFPGIVIAVVFFLVGLFTISDYGLNIDEPNHFMRGQALFHYLRTGQKTYDNLDVKHRSEFQYDGQNGIYYLDKKEASHPTLNDILASFSNYIFYQNLGLLGDLEAYHVFEVFISSLLVFLVYLMVSAHYGRFAGMVGSLSMALYPLFFGESRFNIKDPIEAAFFSYTVYLFYLAVNRKKSKYIILSGIFFAFALGTKFNAAFIPFILVLYLIIRFYSDIVKYKINVFKKIPLRIYQSFLFAGITSLLIYLYFSPQLWSNPLGKFLNEQIAYYIDIGTGVNDQPDYGLSEWHLYPIFFVIISTPLIILLYTILGIYGSIRTINKDKEKFPLLLILWLLVSLLRVTIPGTSIYSGVRQIMEYVPAIAALSGLGAYFFVVWFHSYIARFLHISKKPAIALLQLLIILSFIPITIKLISMHPNENIYVNPLVGGLKGAVEKKIPGAGETMGNAYLQGIWWLNEHAEKNAGFKPAVGLGSNIPTQFVRKDLKLGNVFSGMKREGEYMLGMQSVDFPPPRYSAQYLNKFLNPVHVVYVDGVAIVKVWKNDREHTKKGYLNEKTEENIKVSGGTSNGYVDVKIQNPAFITRIDILHDNKDCLVRGEGEVYYSDNDNDLVFLSPDELYNGQGVYGASLQTENRFVYFFPAVKAKWIRVLPSDPNLCLLQVKTVSIYSLRDLVP